MRNEKVKMKNEKCGISSDEWLEQYLAGKTPLHADRLNLPSDEELDAAEAEFDRMTAERKQPARRILLWPWAVGIAAALVLTFILWKTGDTKETAPLATNEIPKAQEHEQEGQPLMAQLTEPERPATIKKAGHSHAPKRVEEPTEENIDVEAPLTEKIAGLTIVPTSADLGPGNKMRLGAPCPMTTGEETLPQEDVSPIPPDKQALADIYLAEVALQVVYERQAQAEALRAYAASITDEEVPQPIIAF